MQASCLPLLLPCFVEFSDLLHEGFCNRILLAGVALEANERVEAFRLLVLGLAVCKAWQSAETSPVRRAGIGVVSTCERLSGEGAEELWKDYRVLEQRLEVAGTGLDDGARSEAVGCELSERDLGEIVEGSVAMFT